MTSILGLLLAAGGCEGNRNESDVVRASTLRVSLPWTGRDGNGLSKTPDLSADGRYVVFGSTSTNLVPGDTNGASDIFLRDLHTQTTTLVSVSIGGSAGNGASVDPSISDDGQFVAFSSAATDLVLGDTNGTSDIFVRDLATATTTRISVNSVGLQATGGSSYPSISGDGRYVAFLSADTDLVSGDSNGWLDVYRKDRIGGGVARVSIEGVDDLTADGENPNSHCFGPSISGDGRYVAFSSTANDLHVDDPDSTEDVFLRDLSSSSLHLISRASASGSVDGVKGTGGSGSLVMGLFSGEVALSQDGRFVAFTSVAANLVSGDANGDADVFLRDWGQKKTERVSINTHGIEGADESSAPTLSEDGRYVAWSSSATNLVSDDTNASFDVFLRDRTLGQTVRVSVRTFGGEGAWLGVPLAIVVGGRPALSANGRYVVFESEATNLVDDDANGFTDVYWRGPLF